MQLPVRIVDHVEPQLLVSVDGAWGQPGLNLSHWPGNATPADLKHDLSSGCALAFARLAPQRQEELARGCTAIANNHYDTDGVCAIFAVRHPEAALARENVLLETAAAGDLFRFPNERAFAIDAIVTGLADPERSPWHARFAGLDARARHEVVVHELLDVLPRLLDGEIEPFADLWRGPLEQCQAERRALAAATRDELVHLDLTIWTGNAERDGAFDPGRHALLGSCASDRVLSVGRRGHGASYRFVINTTSWFELVSRRALARPDLALLATRLNELEGSTPDDELAWRAQDAATPSPELWFGRREHVFFAEHCDALAPSRLDPVRVRAQIVEALRGVWTFPDEL